MMLFLFYLALEWMDDPAIGNGLLANVGAVSQP
jgi:hypothetical protein